MADPRVRLFTHPISHYCVSAERMLAFKGIPFTRVRVPYHDRRALVDVSGQDYIPTMLWDRTVVRWDEIPAFLDRQRATPALRPPRIAALADVLENWGHQVVEERVWRAVVTEMLPALAPAERWAFEEMQNRARGPWHVLEARRAEFAKEAGEYLARVDRMLADRTWILDEPSVADFGVYGAISPWWTAGRATPPRLRNLRRWAVRIGRLPRGRPTASDVRPTPAP